MKYRYTYSVMDMLMADAVKPTPESKQRHQLTRMWEGLRAIETAPEPTNDDWRVCSDAVNLVETLVREGEPRPDDSGKVVSNWWRDCAGDWVQIHDSGKLLLDAVTAMAAAGIRKINGGQIRLDSFGIKAVRGVLEDYSELLELLPARSIIRAHRLTEKRISNVLAGKRLPHDLKIVDLRGAA